MVIFNISEKWSNGNKREFSGFDPDDERVEAMGTLCMIDGKGNCKLEGDRRRVYCYYSNYNAILTLILIPHFKDEDDSCSLKLRCRHNEPGRNCNYEKQVFDGNRFGGYGFAVHRKKCQSWREPTHPCHDQRKEFRLPKFLEYGRQVKIRYTVRDDGKKVYQKGEIDYLDGNGFMVILEARDKSPEPWMIDRKIYESKSYLWIRNHGEGFTVRNVSLEILP